MNNCEQTIVTASAWPILQVSEVWRYWLQSIFDTWASVSFGFDTSCAILSILAGNAIISILADADQKYSHLPWKWLCMQQ